MAPPSVDSVMGLCPGCALLYHLATLPILSSLVSSTIITTTTLHQSFIHLQNLLSHFTSRHLLGGEHSVTVMLFSVIFTEFLSLQSHVSSHLLVLFMISVYLVPQFDLFRVLYVCTTCGVYSLFGFPDLSYLISLLLFDPFGISSSSD